MRHYLLIGILVLAVITLTTNQVRAQDESEILLRPQLLQGQELSFTHRTKVDQLITGPGIKQRILADITTHVQIRVVSFAADGSAQVELVHTRITSDTSTEPAQFARERYDSANAEMARGEVALALQPAIGEIIALRIGPSGKTKVTEGLSDLRVPQRARSTFLEMFADAAIESTYADLFHITDTVDAVPIGHKWMITRQQPDQLGKKVLQIDLTLVKIEGSDAIIDETGKSMVEIKSGPDIPKVKLLNSSIRGRSIWDCSTGTVRSLLRTESDRLKIHTLDDVVLDSTVTRVTEISRVMDTAEKDGLGIMGATKEHVDALLHGWNSREDGLSTPRTKVFRYTQDVIVIVGFRNGEAIGVAVVENPGAGTKGIAESRFQELVQLVGQEPSHRDIKRDAKGIREFYVGDTESW